MSGCKCDGCGSPGAVPTQWGESLCPACATEYARAYAACDHLKFLMRGVMRDYLATWGTAPHIARSFVDEAGVIAQEVADELLAEMKPATRRNLKLKSA